MHIFERKEETRDGERTSSISWLSAQAGWPRLKPGAGSTIQPLSWVTWTITALQLSVIIRMLELDSTPAIWLLRKIRLPLCVCFTIYLFWLERQIRFMERKRERNILNLLVHCPNAHNSRRWADLKPGVRIFLGSPTWLQGSRAVGRPLLLFQATGMETDGKWKSHELVPIEDASACKIRISQLSSCASLYPYMWF